MFNVDGLSEWVLGKGLFIAQKVAISLIVLIGGLWLIRAICGLIERSMEKKSIDASLRHFLSSFLRILLKIVLFVTVLSVFGIETTSFVAIIGALGLAVGLALQGSLANFAGGALILFFKPFKVGDVIEAQGYIGKVHQIQIFTTILKTPDNKTVIIPNGALSNGSMINYSSEKERRIDMAFGIGYEDSISKARKVIYDIIKGDKRILKDPEPQILVSELADSSVNFSVRVWAKGEDYWNIYFDMQEKVKVGFDKNNISIPYPQTDVHLHK